MVVESASVSAVLTVAAETSTVPPVAVEPPFMNASLTLLSTVAAPAAPAKAPEPSTSVVTVVVLVDVMLKSPLLLPALTVEPSPTWAIAEELTIDSAIAASTGLRFDSARSGSNGWLGVDRGGRICRDDDVAAGLVDRDLRRCACHRDRRARLKVGDGRGDSQGAQNAAERSAVRVVRCRTGVERDVIGVDRGICDADLGLRDADGCRQCAVRCRRRLGRLEVDVAARRVDCDVGDGHQGDAGDIESVGAGGGVESDRAARSPECDALVRYVLSTTCWRPARRSRVTPENDCARSPCR